MIVKWDITSGKSNKCGYFTTCFKNKFFGISSITVNQQIRFQITRQSHIQALCSSYHSYAINAILKITCDAITTPRKSPTSNTLQPTKSPTQNPTTICTNINNYC